MMLKALDGRELRWQLKQLCRYSPALSRKGGLRNADAFLASLTAAQQQNLAHLQQRYPLRDWPRLCDAREYRENLTLLDILDQHLPPLHSPAVGLDIGCRNFSYLPALSAYSAHPWHGVELDAHVRYWNGFTRRAYGEWMARQRSACRYIAGSLLDVKGSYDCIVWLLPFVVEEPLAAWGLPRRFFQPEPLLQHAFALLKPGGLMLVVNQGEGEAEVQQDLFIQGKIPARSLGELHSVHSPFRKQRFGWLIAK